MGLKQMDVWILICQRRFLNFDPAEAVFEF